MPTLFAREKALTDNRYKYEEIVLGDKGITYSSLAAVTGAGTVPQVFIDGELIGTADDLEKWLSK